MAAGDNTLFNVFYQNMANKVHNMNGDTFKLGIITSTITPTRDDATPAWGATSGVDYDGNEVTPGGNYAAGGPTIANTTITLSQANDDITFDGDNVTIAQNGSNPTNARWAIMYNETATNNEAVGFIDFGAVTNLSLSAFTFNFNANGIFKMGLGTLT